MHRNSTLRALLAAVTLSIIALESPTATAQRPETVNESAPAAAPAPRTPVKADEARGFERAPEPSRVLVFPAIGRVLGAGVGGLVYGLTYPFRGAYTLEARYGVASKVKSVFYNDAETAGVLPSASFLNGFGLNLGAKAFHNDLAGNGERVSLSASYGGEVSGSAQLKVELPELTGGRTYQRLRLRGELNPDLLFAGIGNGTGVGSGLDPRASRTQTRYQQRRLLGLLEAGVVLGPPTRRLRVGVSLIHNQRRFDALDDSQAGVSVDKVYDTAAIVGFEDGFSLTEGTLDIELDLLDQPGINASGAVVRAFAGGAPQVGEFGFYHWGAEVVLTKALWLPGRVLAVRLVHEGVVADGGDIPFTDLPRLGGAGLLRGYVRDRFRDELSAVATAEYHYPIHANAAGALYLEAGKVARTYDELVGIGLPTDWHPAVGGALMLIASDEVKFRLDVAYGDAIAVYFSTDVLDAFKKRGREL